MNDLNYAFDAYLGDCARRGLTANSRRKYRETLWAFGDFVDERDCDRITTDHCRRFLDRWADASAATKAGHDSILRQFFAFLVEETVIDRSPMDRVKRPRRKRPEDLDVVTITSSDVDKLFAAAEGWQEILCMSVLAYMGPRRTAAAIVRRRDVNLEHGTIRFKEKGGKVAVKPLPDELVAIIRAADQQSVWSSPDEYLIPNRRQHRNKERSAKVIYDTVKKVAERAGVKTHVHALRAAFAVRMDEQYPGRLIAVKELLGHARIETTMVYLRRKDREREMETVRGLSWGSVFPPNPAMPPTGFEPVLPDSPGGQTDRTEADTPSLPLALRAKLDELRDRREATADRP